MDNVQGDLEALKEFLRNGEDYQLDANALLSVSIQRKFDGLFYINKKIPEKENLHFCLKIAKEPIAIRLFELISIDKSSMKKTNLNEISRFFNNILLNFFLMTNTGR